VQSVVSGSSQQVRVFRKDKLMIASKSYTWMTNEELITYLTTEGNLTSLEVQLVDRLVTAIDEVTALTNEINLLTPQ